MSKDLGISCGLNLHHDASATMCLAGQGEARRHAESVDTGGFHVGQVHHEEGRHEREPSRLDDEAAGKTDYGFLSQTELLQWSSGTCPRRRVDRWHRDGHGARPPFLTDIPSGHVVVSRFVCALCLVIHLCDRYRWLK